MSAKRVLPGIARLLNPRNKGHLMTQSPEYQQVAFQQLKLIKKNIQNKRNNAHAVRRNATWQLLVGDRVYTLFYINAYIVDPKDGLGARQYPWYGT